MKFVLAEAPQMIMHALLRPWPQKMSSRWCFTSSLKMRVDESSLDESTLYWYVGVVIRALKSEKTQPRSNVIDGIGGADSIGKGQVW